MRCYENVAGDGGLAAPLAVLIVILAVAAALYAAPHSPPGGATATVVTGVSSSTTATSTTRAAGETPSPAGGGLVEPNVTPVNETGGGRPCPLRALSLEAVEESGEVKFTVEASLPNPCYSVRVLNVTVDNSVGLIVVEANLSEPGPGVFCVQRLQQAYLSFTVEESQLAPGRSYQVVLLANPGSEAECKAPLGSYTYPGR